MNNVPPTPAAGSNIVPGSTNSPAALNNKTGMPPQAGGRRKSRRSHRKGSRKAHRKASTRKAHRKGSRKAHRKGERKSRRTNRK